MVVELIMAVHVDDIAIAGPDEACRDFHAALNTKFPTNNLGEYYSVYRLCLQA